MLIFSLGSLLSDDFASKFLGALSIRLKKPELFASSLQSEGFKILVVKDLKTKPMCGEQLIRLVPMMSSVKLL